MDNGGRLEGAMPEVLKRVGRFDLLEVIGRGGAAVVYLAVQRDLQRNVALKELAPFHLADSSFAERFVEESRLAGAMNHANVVTVHEFFEDGSVPYIAMEYLPYGSLRQYIGRLSTAQIAGVLEGVLAGLAHGEAHGIVHRDLKPENLLVAIDGRVKIADFGVARAYSKAATRAVVTVAGTTIGTPAYMSPEQALGGDLTPATDLYSLGIVAWELFTGQVPFEENDTPVAVLYRHVHEPVPSVRTVAPDVDAGIAVWLEKMLAKRPEDRFQRADDAWLALEDVVLDLLGPRWRREARLVVEDELPRSRRTLTPAPFDRPDDAAESVQPTPIPETVSGPAAEVDGDDDGWAVAAPDGDAGTEAVKPTIAPSKRREPSHTTMFRIARRHHADDEEGAATPETLRRRMIVLGIVAAMVVAAVVGVVVAGTGGTSPRRGPTRAQIQAQERAAAAARAKAAAVAAANKQVSGLAQKLAVSANGSLGKVLNAPTPAQQAKDLTAVESDYAAAAGKVAQVSASPLAPALSATLRTMAGAYGRAAQAARAGNQRQWNRAWTAIKADQRKLQGQVGKLPAIPIRS
jgi:serine/threonine protein kinase